MTEQNNLLTDMQTEDMRFRRAILEAFRELPPDPDATLRDLQNESKQRQKDIFQKHQRNGGDEVQTPEG